ncbi:hypothetical protein CPB97_011298, partial [Podila verticillata]
MPVPDPRLVWVKVTAMEATREVKPSKWNNLSGVITKKPIKKARRFSAPCPVQRRVQDGNQMIVSALKHLPEMGSEYKECR